MEQANFVYILQCRDGSLYTGWTCNLEKRVAVHSVGMGAKYTRSRLPVKLVYWEKCNSRSAAMKREYAIKQLSRQKKLELIQKNCSYVNVNK